MSVNYVKNNIMQMDTPIEQLTNEKTNHSSQTETSALSSKEDNAVKISISKEGMKSYRRNLNGSNKNADKANIIKQAKQATNALSANNYANELNAEIKKLKGGLLSGSAHGHHHKERDYVRAYKKLYDEIIQGYQKGTRERYVEEKTSETGYRKMTMEEELDGLEKAFRMAKNRVKTKKMISGELKRLRKGKDITQKTQDTIKKHL